MIVALPFLLLGALVFAGGCLHARDNIAGRRHPALDPERQP